MKKQESQIMELERKEIREKLDTFVERHFDNVSCMENYNEHITKLAEFAQAHDKELFREFIEFIEDGLNKIYYDQVEEVAESIQRKDGQSGAKWSYEETSKVAEDSDIKKECYLKFWYAMNKAYAIFYNPSYGVEIYINLAKDMIKDEFIEEEIKARFNKLHEEK